MTPQAVDYLKAGGDILGGFGGLMQGFEMQDAYNYNSGILEQQADQIMFSSDLNIEEIGQAEDELLSTQKAMYAKAGVTQVGSPTDVALQSATNFEFDKLVSRYNAEVAAANVRSKADINKYYGKEVAREGVMNLGKSLLSAAGGLL